MEISLFTSGLLSLLTLTFLEVVLAVDNLVFISIITQRLPLHQQKKARRLGLTLAWSTRLLLLAFALWLTKLVTPLFTIFNFAVSGRDIFLFTGGLFLLVKAIQEIHAELEGLHGEGKKVKVQKFFWVVTQIAILDIVFSLDSVITAVGLTSNFLIMAIAITIAIILMIVASEPLSGFIEKHPTIKMLALCFLIMIGTVLVADGLHFHVPRGYIYFSICFSIFVEWLNSIHRKRRGSK